MKSILARAAVVASLGVLAMTGGGEVSGAALFRSSCDELITGYERPTLKEDSAPDAWCSWCSQMAVCPDEETLDCLCERASICSGGEETGYCVSDQDEEWGLTGCQESYHTFIYCQNESL